MRKKKTDGKISKKGREKEQRMEEKDRYIVRATM